jgi:hypothetical protein
MYTYLRNIGPLFSIDFPFLESSLYQLTLVAFYFCLLEPSLVLLTSRNNKFLDCVFMIPACVKTFIFNFVQHPLSSQKGNVRANHIMFIVLLWPDYVLKCSRFFLGMKSCRTRLVIYKDHFLVKF